MNRPVDALQKKLCKKIRECREALGMTRSQLAKKIGQNERFVAELEDALHDQQISVYSSCAEALDLTLTELLDLTAADQELVVLTGDEHG